MPFRFSEEAAMPTNITISLRDDLHRRTRVKAAEYNVSISTFVASILEVYFLKSDARAKRLATPPAPGSAQPAAAIPAANSIQATRSYGENKDDPVQMTREIVEILGERRVQETTGKSFEGTQRTPIAPVASTPGIDSPRPPPPPHNPVHS